MTTQTSQAGEKPRMNWHGALRLTFVVCLAIPIGVPLGNCTCSEDPATDTPAWQVVFTASGFDNTGRSVAEAPGGDLYLTGTVFRNDNAFQVYVMRRTPDGNPRWIAYAGSATRYEEGIRLAVHPDGGVVVFANSVDRFGVDSTSDYFLARIDAEGAVLWDKRFGGNSDDTPADIVVLDDGYALLGTTASKGSGGTDLELIRTDGNGAIQWSRTYGGAAADRAVGLVATADGGFALFGDTESMGSDSVQYYLVKTGADGREAWHQTYGTTPLNHAGGLVQTTDGGFLLAGSTDIEPYLIIDPYLVKTDATGQRQWERVISRGEATTIRTVTPLAGGGYALVGSTTEFYYQSQCSTILVLEVTEAGERAATGVYGGLSGTEGYQGILVQDGSLVVAGTSFNREEAPGQVYEAAYLAKVPLLSNP